MIIFTPRQFTLRAEFYHQLAQLTAAGIGLVRSIDQIQLRPPAGSYRAPLRQLSAELAAGNPFAESLRRVGGWLPEFDVALLQAGEMSGRLDVVFRVLSDYYEERARLSRQLIASLAYPVALFHFAVFIFPFPEFFRTGDFVAYALQTFGILLPVYGVVALVIFACQSRHGEHWRAVVEGLTRVIPVLGTSQRFLALARLAGALEALISSGVNIVDAWELAARACGSPALRREVSTWKRELAGGATPAEMVVACGMFPEMFQHLYTTGEQTGKLDECLRKLQEHYLEEGTRKMRASVQLFAWSIYLLVMAAISIKIIGFWTGYFKMIQDATGGS